MGKENIHTRRRGGSWRMKLFNTSRLKVPSIRLRSDELARSGGIGLQLSHPNPLASYSRTSKGQGTLLQQSCTRVKQNVAA